MYSSHQIATITGGRTLSNAPVTVDHLVYDTRRIQHPASSLFFALRTATADGHAYLQNAYEKGVRAFVVDTEITVPDAAVIRVPDTLAALQSLAAHHRSMFSIPVVGITGSNGKTVVKEWLNALLQDDYNIVRSPKSFNSQLGVPLSVWEMNEAHTLGIFEAGISQPGEMPMLQRIIRPTIGVLTNIGEAHSEGFASAEEKLAEKLKLFTDSDVIIGPKQVLNDVEQPVFTWSYTESATLQLMEVVKSSLQTSLTALYAGRTLQVAIPFTDEASIENAIICWCVLLHLGIDEKTIPERFLHLHPVDMRLQLLHAINSCLLINDSYSADPTSLRIALDFLRQQSAGRRRTVILSDFFESGRTDDDLYKEIAHLLTNFAVENIIAIGQKISDGLKPRLVLNQTVTAYESTTDFIERFRSSAFHHEIILLKGARRFGFERIASLFQQKLHGTVLQLNLTALVHNLKTYQKQLRPATKIMAMVKAFAYGSGGAEIASVLQYHNVAYLGVAYTDEGVELVKAGIRLPVMVMNAEADSFAVIAEHGLQPVLYSMELLRKFEAFVNQQSLTAYPVHLEIETGMNRLGFSSAQIAEVAVHLSTSTYLKVESVFSHLAGSEDPAEDGFTQLQASRFNEAATALQQALPYRFIKHISNSAAIVRHPGLQMDMVRLGIGLYGVEPGLEDELELYPVATLRSTVAQIKELQAGESVSYNRRGVVRRPSRIATVRIGYADGYSRRLSNGVGKMLVKGRLAPIIGTVCMDMTMLDVTDIPGVAEGDDVIVFGPGLPVQRVANEAGTIPYEIMTSVSQRVKRVYYYE